MAKQSEFSKRGSREATIEKKYELDQLIVRHRQFFSEWRIARFPNSEKASPSASASKKKGTK